MPALSTQIVDAVAAQLAALFPGANVITRRGSGTVPAYMPGDPAPFFSVTSNAGQEQTGGTALKVFCAYDVTVHYLTREPPGTKGESDDARTKQEAVRRAFTFAAWAAVPGVNRCVPQVQKPYDNPFADKTVCDSAVKLAFQSYEPRN